MIRLRKIIDLILTLLLITNLCLTFYLSAFMNGFKQKKEATGIIFIERGLNVEAIGRQLEKNGLIKDARSFRLAYSLYYSPNFLKAGEYEFKMPVNPKKIMLEMIAGKVLLHPLTIPEGLTYKEIAELLENKNYPFKGSFLDACHKVELISDLDSQADNLEGYLFPETYHFSRGIEAEEMVRAMVTQFRKVFGKEQQERAQKLNLTVREVLTMASLIEKETSMIEEKPLVSAVFHNRLRLGMKLDCDPTIIYALKLENRFDGNIRLKDKNLKSPYNTYLYPGLPPGPICNPGYEALEAALYPASVDYLYFVSRNDGSHVFNRSYSEHLKAVSKYQLKK
ncbi:MAG: endolytic transglycosylase MltG [Acidobacteriota bacterium]|nr:endolytic transglycosylase MltG [Acidobacteriota bacterium]